MTVLHHRFVARIEATGSRGSCAVSIPPDVDAALGGGRARVALVGTADGRPFRTAAAPTGGGDSRMFLFSKEMQIATGHVPGEDVEFEIARERSTAKDDGLDELHDALGRNERARDAFADLPPSHKREYLDWIAEAKQPSTRAKRIADAVARLANGAATKVPAKAAPKAKKAPAKKPPAKKAVAKKASAKKAPAKKAPAKKASAKKLAPKIAAKKALAKKPSPAARHAAR